MIGMTSPELARQLADQGYCIVPGLLPDTTISGLAADLDAVFPATPYSEGAFYGYRTKRFGGLLKRSSRTEALVREPTILGAVEAILGGGCDRIQLNVAQAIEIHPGEQRQLPHRDHDMWPIPKGAQEFLVNVIWPLDRFTAENGATHIYPRSHGPAGMAREDPGEPVIATCEPGSAICFLGSTAHGAGANVSDKSRRGVVIGYSLGWLKPYENSCGFPIRPTLRDTSRLNSRRLRAMLSIAPISAITKASALRSCSVMMSPTISVRSTPCAPIRRQCSPPLRKPGGPVHEPRTCYRAHL